MTPRTFDDEPRCRRPKLTGQSLAMRVILQILFWIYWMGGVTVFINPLTVGPFMSRQSLLPNVNDERMLLGLVWIAWSVVLLIGLQLLFGLMAISTDKRRLKKVSTWVSIYCSIFSAACMICIMTMVTFLDARADPPVSHEPIEWRISASISLIVLYVGGYLWSTIALFRRRQVYHEIY